LCLKILGLPQDVTQQFNRRWKHNGQSAELF
jgi:hypothetical protein